MPGLDPGIHQTKNPYEEDGWPGHLLKTRFALLPGHDDWGVLMFLIGQYDSPFVRRVAIALRLYGFKYDHKPWSTFGEADQIAPYNPLRRVPTLVLDSGEALIESTIILDYLDELAGEGKAMIASHGAGRRRHLRLCALATGLADKAVSLLYERVLRQEPSKVWVDRCHAQIGDVLGVLEKERTAATTPWLFGERIGHSDVVVACVLRFTSEAHPHLFDAARYPELAAHAAKCEALPPFAEIVQPLSPPKG